jgi:hypothetical protein
VWPWPPLSSSFTEAVTITTVRELSDTTSYTAPIRLTVLEITEHIRCYAYISQFLYSTITMAPPFLAYQYSSVEDLPPSTKINGSILYSVIFIMTIQPSLYNKFSLTVLHKWYKPSDSPDKASYDSLIFSKQKLEKQNLWWLKTNLTYYKAAAGDSKNQVWELFPVLAGTVEQAWMCWRSVV